MRKLLIEMVSPRLYLELRRFKLKYTHPGLHARYQTRRHVTGANRYSYKSMDDTRSLFIHIPKCAGSSIAQGLYNNIGGGHTRLDDYLNIFSPSEVLSYFKFTIVRNPWDRLVSAFHFLKAGGCCAEDQAWSKRELSRYRTFDEFVKGWLNTENIWKYYHFQPQYHYMYDADNKINLDFIGYFENLDQDFSYVAERLSLDCYLPKMNVSSREKYQSYYTEETKRIVEKVYAEDIENLSYSFDNSNLKNQLKNRYLSSI